MTHSERLIAGSKGVTSAIAKRGVYIVLVLVVLQVFGVQRAVDTAEDRRQESEKQQQERDVALIRQALEEIKQQNICLTGLILVPLAERPADTTEALKRCGAKAPAGLSSSSTVAPVSPVVSSGRPSGQTAVLEQSTPTARKEEPTTSAPPERDDSESPTQTPAPQGRAPLLLDTSLTLPLLGIKVETKL